MSLRVWIHWDCFVAYSICFLKNEKMKSQKAMQGTGELYKQPSHSKPGPSTPDMKLAHPCPFLPADVLLGEFSWELKAWS
jgi:hypothetical protein